MSPNAEKAGRRPSHRKPRSAASHRVLRAGLSRAGVTGGILTLAVAGVAVPASTAEAAPTHTAPEELPTKASPVSTTLASTAEQNAEATAQSALDYELSAQRDNAADKARAEAKKAREAAVRKARAARRKAREAAARKAAARAKQASASSGAQATTLSATTSNATGNAAALLSFVKAQLGKAYVLGATGPSSYDCSGLVQAAFKQVGISLPRVSQSQSTAGTQVSLNDLKPGDILYWGSAGSAYHVAIYVGDNQFIGAQNPSSGVVEHPLDYDQPTGAVRVL